MGNDVAPLEPCILVPRRLASQTVFRFSVVGGIKELGATIIEDI